MNIRNITLPDGTPCASVWDAVQKFKCPGPCDPDCPLYPAIRVHDDMFGHMCHDTIIDRYPVSVLDAMRCSYEVVVGNDENGKPPAQPCYAAVIRSQAVRDVQFCKDPDCNPADDDSWEDLPDAEIWLGLFQGPDALQKAAEYGMTSPENIRLIPVDPDRTENKQED